MTIIAILGLFGSAWLLARQRSGLRFDEAALYGALLAFFEVVLLMQVLGFGAVLSPAGVWGLTLGLSALNLFFAFFRGAWKPGRRFVAPPAFLGPALIAVLVTLGVRLFLAWKLPPEGWDSLGYHLPIVLKWLRQGNLDTSGIVGAQRYFAWNGDLVTGWLAFLNGNLALAKISQVLGIPLLAAAGSVIGRRLAGLRWAWPCAAAMVGLPIVLIQAGIAYVDVFQTGFWLAAAAAALALARSGRGLHLWAFGLAFGLCLGSKSTVYFLAPLVVILVVALIVAPRRPRFLAGQAALAVGLMVVAGAGSYVRNVLLTGNPIFPYGLSLAGIPIFKGIVSASDMPAYMEHWFVSSRWGWIVYPFGEHIRSVIGYSHINGFGPLFAVAWLAFPLAIYRAARLRDVLALAFFGLFPLVAIFFFVLQPVQLPRYIIFAAAVPIAGLAYLLRRSRVNWQRAGRMAWTIGMVVGCLGVFAYLFRAPGVRAAGREILAGRPVDGGEYYAKQYPAVGSAWAAVDARLRAGDTVVVDYDELLLPWAGLPPRADVRVIVYGDCIYPQVPFGRSEGEWLREVERVSPRFVAVWCPGWNPGREVRLCRAIAACARPYALLGRWTSRDFGWVEVYEAKRDP